MLSRLAASLLPRCAFSSVRGPLACAVSGGSDSLALLILAVASGADVTAYHVDHGLREGSDKEAEIVELAAKGLGAEFVSLKVTIRDGPNLEARARAARLSVLPAGIATGHTADDQVETILLNLLRGSGSAGLAGMVVGPRHPILRLRRAECRSLVNSLGLSVIEDPSNDDPSYLRNRVRHELVLLLNDISSRDIVPVLTRQAEILRDEDDLLDELAMALDPLDARALREAPPALSRRVVRRLLRDSDGAPPDSAAVERVLSVARGETRACEVHGGRRVVRSAGRLRLE